VVVVVAASATATVTAGGSASGTAGFVGRAGDIATVGPPVVVFFSGESLGGRPCFRWEASGVVVVVVAMAGAAPPADAPNTDGEGSAGRRVDTGLFVVFIVVIDLLVVLP
jgi:hypothetical protein